MFSVQMFLQAAKEQLKYSGAVRGLLARATPGCDVQNVHKQHKLYNQRKQKSRCRQGDRNFGSSLVPVSTLPALWDLHEMIVVEEEKRILTSNPKVKHWASPGQPTPFQ